MIEFLYGTWILCLVALLVYVLHKMFYKTKSTARRTSGSATVTTQNGDELRSQQFYIYSIDGRTTSHSTPPNTHLDLPPKYEDVIKDPNYVRREVS